MKITAICLAAGQGKRMESKIQKQYLLLKEKPVLYYSLKCFQESRVDEVILVVPSGEIEYCRKNIVEKYGFSKVKYVLEGGKERYHSVIQGLSVIEDADLVMIHDGARPFLKSEIIERCIEGASRYRACIVGMPVKDTIKVLDKEQRIESTPQRSSLWQVQTPQCFDYSLIREAYRKLEKEEKTAKMTDVSITDDAMVVEYFMDQKVKVVEGSYQNIKITTPEDMIVANAFLEEE
ncbi:MAG: 2-C-methyl-D-erythritol 4-phosphate cytidylyltransferase [Lachnospiraceae bacterium]|nr:2-C-methyl-D-erythritol 4-phosphate cytidylyltransferase [Lachnospiraceae bacterium]